MKGRQSAAFFLLQREGASGASGFRGASPLRFTFHCPSWFIVPKGHDLWSGDQCLSRRPSEAERPRVEAVSEEAPSETCEGEINTRAPTGL